MASIDIPDSVKSIGRSAFSGCKKLTSVIIPSSIIDISLYAFSYCTALTSITIPNSVTSISNYTFSGCSALTEIVLHNSITSIGYGAFKDCGELKTIVIPDTVTEIGDIAFDNTAYYNDLSNWENDVLYIGKHLLKAKTTLSGEYAIKAGTKTVADNAFYDCSNLTQINIPDSVVSVGAGALDNTAYYNDLSNWENDVLYIGNHLIKAKTTLSGEYTVKAGTKTISGNAFYDCGSLTAVSIPNSVTRIGNYAFLQCVTLETISIPNSITSIGNYAFAYCSVLDFVTIPDSITNISSYAFYGCVALSSITIPDSITSIGEYAFYYCYALPSITLPDSVTSIGLEAFEGCSILTIILTENSYAHKYAQQNDIPYEFSTSAICKHSYEYKQVDIKNPLNDIYVCSKCGDSYLAFDFDKNGIIDDADKADFNKNGLPENIDVSAFDFDNDGSEVLSVFDNTVVTLLLSGVEISKMADANIDGESNVLDIVRLKRLEAGVETYGKADITQDNASNSDDLVFARKALLFLDR